VLYNALVPAFQKLLDVLRKKMSLAEQQATHAQLLSLPRLR